MLGGQSPQFLLPKNAFRSLITLELAVFSRATVIFVQNLPFFPAAVWYSLVVWVPWQQSLHANYLSLSQPLLLASSDCQNVTPASTQLWNAGPGLWIFLPPISSTSLALMSYLRRYEEEEEQTKSENNIKINSWPQWFPEEFWFVFVFIVVTAGSSWIHLVPSTRDPTQAGSKLYSV